MTEKQNNKLSRMIPAAVDSWYLTILSHPAPLTYRGYERRVTGMKHPSENLKIYFIFSLECEEETSGGSPASQISEGGSGAIWKPAGTHKSDGRWLQTLRGVRREIANPFISNVDLALSIGHLKINCQTTFEETAYHLLPRNQQVASVSQLEFTAVVTEVTKVSYPDSCLTVQHFVQCLQVSFAAEPRYTPLQPCLHCKTVLQLVISWSAHSPLWPTSTFQIVLPLLLNGTWNRRL